MLKLQQHELKLRLLIHELLEMQYLILRFLKEISEILVLNEIHEQNEIQVTLDLNE
jgi:hypothetical protein